MLKNLLSNFSSKKTSLEVCSKTPMQISYSSKDKYFVYNANFNLDDNFCTMDILLNKRRIEIYLNVHTNYMEPNKNKLGLFRLKKLKNPIFRQ